jgi:hypothetical protein
MIPVTVMCCRFGNLVYVRNLKCASSYFYGNLTINYGWTVISYDEIDWQREHVFSHIMHPVRRNLKGKLEYLKMIDSGQLLLNPMFLMFMRDICFFDEHSVSYHDTFVDRCDLIDWIPLNEPPSMAGRPDQIRSDQDFLDIARFDRQQQEYWLEARRLTEILIHHFQLGHPLFDRWDHNLFARPADNVMLKQFDRILDDHNQRDLLQSQLYLYLSKDIELYEMIQSKFNPQAQTWPEMTWLK